MQSKPLRWRIAINNAYKWPRTFGKKNHLIHCRKSEMIGATFLQIYMQNSGDAKDVRECETLSHPLAAAQLLWWDAVAFGQRAPPGGLCNFRVVSPLGEEVRAVLRTHSRWQHVSFCLITLDTDWFPSSSIVCRIQHAASGHRHSHLWDCEPLTAGGQPDPALVARQTSLFKSVTFKVTVTLRGPFTTVPPLTDSHCIAATTRPWTYATPSNLWLAATIHSTCAVKSSSSISGAVAMETAGAQCG